LCGHLAIGVNHFTLRLRYTFVVTNSLQRSDLLRTRLRAFVGELPALAQGNVEALHHARVASRRLRELLPILALDRRTTRKLNRRLRTVTQQLGTVRELDVLILLLEELQQSEQYAPAALNRIGAAVVQSRATAGERLADTLPPVKLQRLAERLEDAARFLESGEAASRRLRASARSRAWVRALEARLARRARRVRSAIESVGPLYVPEPLHGVRIALKKLRYAAELSGDTARQQTTTDVAALKTAQNLLGRLHDLEVLLAWVRDVQASLSAPDFAALRDLQSLAYAVERDCRQLHARYLRDRVKLLAIADRLGGGRRQTVASGRMSA
jgi:CHAD domain-containing protein